MIKKALQGLFILTLCFTGTFTFVFAQPTKGGWFERPENLIHGNIFGEASLISLKFERSFFNTEFFFVTVDIGFGFQQEFEIVGCISILGIPCEEDKLRSYLTIPLHLSLNFGKGLHYFEIGYGRTYLITSGNSHYVNYPILGFRTYPSKSYKTYIRIYTHLYIPKADFIDYLFFPVGLSIGIAL